MSEYEQKVGIFNPDRFYPDRDGQLKRLEAHYARDEIKAYLGEVGASTEILTNWPEERRGMLTDVGILRHLVAGNIDIYPFDHRLLQSTGYDVRLGKNWYILADPETRSATERHDGYIPLLSRYMPYYNPVDPNAVVQYWKGPYVTSFIESEETINSVEVGLVSKLRPYGIKPSDKIVPVIPHTMFLCHTEEFIGGINVISTQISGKSTVGRNLIEVCSDANLGDVGFRNRWALEVMNKSSHVMIPLIVGEPIATVQFEEVEPPLKPYKGRYQNGENLQNIIDDWKPERILPKWRRFKANE